MNIQLTASPSLKEYVHSHTNTQTEHGICVRNPNNRLNLVTCYHTCAIMILSSFTHSLSLCIFHSFTRQEQIQDFGKGGGRGRCAPIYLPHLGGEGGGVRPTPFLWIRACMLSLFIDTLSLYYLYLHIYCHYMNQSECKRSLGNE